MSALYSLKSSGKTLCLTALSSAKSDWGSMAIVVQLQPKFEELRAKKIYTRAEVVTLLCEFAQSIYPQMSPERIREIVLENF